MKKQVMTKESFEHLPYRDNISCIIFNKSKQFLLVQLAGWPDNWWKFPQGGIEEGETEEAAVCRELREEIGSQNIRIVAKSSQTNQYDWPEDSIQKARYRWRGQIQKFFLVEYCGARKEIAINGNEVQRFKWVGIDDLFTNIDHNHPLFTNYKNIIEKVLLEFGML